MFDGVARHYDRTNDVLSAGNAVLWRIATVKAIGAGPADRVLDIAAGTGTSSAAIAAAGRQVVAPTSRPAWSRSAASATPSRVRRGRRRAAALRRRRRSTPSPSRSACATSTGRRRRSPRCTACSSPAAASSSASSRRRRSARSAPPTAPTCGTSCRSSRGPSRAATAPAYEYLADSINAWPEQQMLSQWLRGAGFTRVAHRNLTLGIVALHRGRKPAVRRPASAAKNDEPPLARPTAPDRRR